MTNTKAISEDALSFKPETELTAPKRDLAKLAWLIHRLAEAMTQLEAELKKSNTQTQTDQRYLDDNKYIL